MIKVAVIGVGSMGKNHARVYFENDDVELVAVADPHPEMLNQISNRYHAKGYSDYKEMLEHEEIEAVSIAVPTSLHKEVAIHTLNKKKHVLLEKPIASTEQEAQEIINCARINNVNLMIGHIERFNPAIIELKKRLNDLGEIYKIDVQRIGPFPSRITDVGVIIDLSVHDIDIIHYLTELFPLRVYAETLRKLHPSHEDSVTTLLRFSGDLKATINIDYLSPTKIRQLQVFGKKGMFRVNYLNQELYFYENTGFTSDSWNSVIEGDMRKIHLENKEPLKSEIEAFISSIIHKQESPVSGEHGLRVLQIANKILSSAQERRIMEINDS